MSSASGTQKNTAKENAIGLYMVGIRDGKPVEAQDNFASPSGYKQHSTGVKDQREGFIEFFEEFVKRCPQREIEVVRALEEDGNVFLQVTQIINGGESAWLTTDFFTTDDNNLMTEHWDVISAYHANKTNASGHTCIDGPTEPAQLDKEQTASNKEVVSQYIERVLIQRDVDAIEEFVSPDLIQHSAELSDGLEAFAQFYRADDCPLSYQELFMSVAEGDMVATLTRARADKQDLCHVDLFRVQDGKIVEHWDNSEPVPPEEELTNSGKF